MKLIIEDLKNKKDISFLIKKKVDKELNDNSTTNFLNTNNKEKSKNILLIKI